jgi:predicted  nucleic acid-binding Zn-ribbon protein
VDLNDVTFVDALGKARLAEMHGQGAHLLAEDLETKAILAEIETGRADLRDGQSIQSNSHGLAGNVTNQLTQLQRLQVELHQINEEFAKAARPLARLAEMNGEQRERLADELRARLARWESVTQQISQVMETASANGHGTPKGNEGESR